MLYYTFTSFTDLLSFNSYTFISYIKAFQAYKQLYTYLEDFYTNLEVEESNLDNKSNKGLAKEDNQDGLIIDFKAYSCQNPRHNLPYISFTDKLGHCDINHMYNQSSYVG